MATTTSDTIAVPRSAVQSVSRALDAVSILVSSSLGPNLTRGKLLPLAKLPEVREVIVVQDATGPRIPKVRYVPLGRPRLGKVLHGFRRVAAMCIQIAGARPSIVMGIYMMPHGLLAYLLGRLTRRRVCIQVIGGPREVIDGGFGMDQWQVPRPSKRLERLYLGMLRRTDILMVVGTETKRYLASNGVAEGRIHVISSKIDPLRFRPMPGESRDYDLIIAAQLIKRKQVDQFLRIVAELRPRHVQLRAAILGDGPLRGDLERQAERLGIRDRVDFLGFHEDVERYYQRARVFVLTSSAEGLSLAMLEAMACGLPVVVPAVGDLADVVRNGETGYLIPNGDLHGFVAALDNLLGNEELRRRIGEKACSTIRQGYLVENGARHWRAALQDRPARDVGATLHAQDCSHG